MRTHGSTIRAASRHHTVEKQHDYNVAFGGPIKKNKTFFYTLWNQHIVESRSEDFATVLTECARQGIFRYYNDINNGNARQVWTVGGVPQAADVNSDGSPNSPNGGPLQYLSVFGNLAANPDETQERLFRRANQHGHVGSNGAASSWDPNVKQLDKTGYVTATLSDMPHANSFDIIGSGDGLNTGFCDGCGATTAPTTYSELEETQQQRKQINVKIDHNFSQRQRSTGLTVTKSISPTMRHCQHGRRAIPAPTSVIRRSCR